MESMELYYIYVLNDKLKLCILINNVRFTKADIQSFDVVLLHNKHPYSFTVFYQKIH